MSNRRKVRPNARPDNNWVNRWAASIDGAQIPGGCDTCDAYQTAHVIDRGITQIKIHHDDWCSTYARPLARADEAREVGR